MRSSPADGQTPTEPSRQLPAGNGTATSTSRLSPNPTLIQPAADSKQAAGANIGNPMPKNHATSAVDCPDPAPFAAERVQRPIRSTRNPAPQYIDAFSADTSGPPPYGAFPKRWWTASREQLRELNENISFNNNRGALNNAKQN